jgi:hypothetical protein
MSRKARRDKGKFKALREIKRRDAIQSIARLLYRTKWDYSEIIKAICEESELNELPPIEEWESTHLNAIHFACRRLESVVDAAERITECVEKETT